MTFRINGTDILPYIANNGLKWSRNDVDGPNAGRSLDGLMHRDYIATKVRWDVTCIPLTSAQLSTVLSLIAPQSVTLEYTDPVTGVDVSGTFYSNNYPATVFTSEGGGLWMGLVFPLIEF